MKPQFEHISMPSGCSIRVFHRQIQAIPFEYHQHPECELTLTLNSRGLRFVGDHIGPYGPHDLVLVPSEMPHTWASTGAIDEARPHVALVLWFAPNWAAQVADLLPEFGPIRKLLKRAAGGLSFPPAAGQNMESRFSSLIATSSRERILAALDLLSELAAYNATPLATNYSEKPATADESDQLARVLTFLHEHYSQPIRISDLCKIGNASERTLHRMFIRHLGENVTGYLARLRIGRACMRLVETESPINEIAADAGFSNLSNFNRHFLRARRMTPRQFRRCFEEQSQRLQLEALDVTQRSPSLASRKSPVHQRRQA